MKRFIAIVASFALVICLLSCSYEGTYDEGYSDGYAIGYEDGYLEGSENSDDEGYDVGYDEEAVKQQAEKYKSSFEIRCTNIDLNSLYEKAGTSLSYSTWLKICEDTYAKDFRNGYVTGYHVKKSGDIGNMLILDDTLCDNNTLKLGYYDGFAKGFKDASA